MEAGIVQEYRFSIPQNVLVEYINYSASDLCDEFSDRSGIRNLPEYCTEDPEELRNWLKLPRPSIHRMDKETFEIVLYRLQVTLSDLVGDEFCFMDGNPSYTLSAGLEGSVLHDLEMEDFDEDNDGPKLTFWFDWIR